MFRLVVRRMYPAARSSAPQKPGNQEQEDNLGDLLFLGSRQLIGRAVKSVCVPLQLGA
jgi:hypothetical protein